MQAIIIFLMKSIAISCMKMLHVMLYSCLHMNRYPLALTRLVVWNKITLTVLVCLSKRVLHWIKQLSSSLGHIRTPPGKRANTYHYRVTRGSQQGHVKAWIMVDGDAGIPEYQLLLDPPRIVRAYCNRARC